MNLNDAFPSSFLKADDLKGHSVTVVIHDVQMEEIGQGQRKDRKLVISFRGKDKKMVCNKTNASVIEKLYGPETEDWIGKPIILAAREVEFQGDMVWAIRVSLVKPATATTAKAATPPPPAPAVEESTADEDVPF